MKIYKSWSYENIVLTNVIAKIVSDHVTQTPK